MQRLYESKQITEAYKFRPSYPKVLLENILKYCNAGSLQKEEEKFGLMIDVGCGSGQACNLLQSHFKKIIGVDISEEQIKQANIQNKFDNISYQIGPAEQIPAADGSVDLITAGIAAHWFDLPNFFSEVERALKPSGHIALFGYVVPKIGVTSQENDDVALEAGKAVNKLLLQGLSENSAEAISSIENHLKYPNIYKAIPYETKERNDDLRQVVLCSMVEYREMVKSLNCYDTYREQKVKELKATRQDITQAEIDEIDLAVACENAIKDMWNIHEVSDDEKIIKLYFEYFLLLARKP